MRIKEFFQSAALACLIPIGANAQNIPQAKIDPAEEWIGYKQPELVFVNEDSTEVGKSFNKYISNPDSVWRATNLKVMQLLYKKPGEMTDVRRISLRIKNMEGIAFTYGMEKPGEREIQFNSNYMTAIEKRFNDASLIVREIDGVLTHETVHVFQLSPKEESEDRSSVIEGIADAIRYYAGVDDISRRRKGGTWTGSYTITGFFIVYLQEKYDRDFLYKLNKYVGSCEKFQWNQATLALLNKPVQELWTEYQASF